MNHDSPIAAIRQAIAFLPPPPNRLSALVWNRAMMPDNVALFKRTATPLLNAPGTSGNYHYRFELVIALDQAGPIQIGETSYILRPGQAALIFPNQFHSFGDFEGSAMEWLSIAFELEESDAVKSLKDAPRILDQTELEQINRIVNEAIHPPRGHPDSLEICYHLSRLLHSMVDAPVLPDHQWNISPANDGKESLLEKVNLYVRSKLPEALTTAELAEALGFSESHLRAVFRARFGISLGRYLRESRLSHAAALIQTTEMSLSEVAQQSGFESLFVFSRAFKKAYEMAPQAYRKFIRTRGGKTE